MKKTPLSHTDLRNLTTILEKESNYYKVSINNNIFLFINAEDEQSAIKSTLKTAKNFNLLQTNVFEISATLLIDRKNVIPNKTLTTFD
jgi:hypothetical protein